MFDGCVNKCTQSLYINYFCIAPKQLRRGNFILALDFKVSFYHAGEGMVAGVCGGGCSHHAGPASQKRTADA